MEEMDHTGSRSSLSSNMLSGADTILENDDLDPAKRIRGSFKTDEIDTLCESILTGFDEIANDKERKQCLGVYPKSVSSLFPSPLNVHADKRPLPPANDQFAKTLSRSELNLSRHVTTQKDPSTSWLQLSDDELSDETEENTDIDAAIDVILRSPTNPTSAFWTKKGDSRLRLEAERMVDKDHGEYNVRVPEYGYFPEKTITRKKSSIKKPSRIETISLPKTHCSSGAVEPWGELFNLTAPVETDANNVDNSYLLFESDPIYETQASFLRLDLDAESLVDSIYDPSVHEPPSRSAPNTPLPQLPPNSFWRGANEQTPKRVKPTPRESRPINNGEPTNPQNFHRQVHSTSTPDFHQHAAKPKTAELRQRSSCRESLDSRSKGIMLFIPERFTFPSEEEDPAQANIHPAFRVPRNLPPHDNLPEPGGFFITMLGAAAHDNNGLGDDRPSGSNAAASRAWTEHKVPPVFSRPNHSPVINRGSGTSSSSAITSPYARTSSMASHTATGHTSPQGLAFNGQFPARSTSEGARTYEGSDDEPRPSSPHTEDERRRERRRGKQVCAPLDTAESSSSIGQHNSGLSRRRNADQVLMNMYASNLDDLHGLRRESQLAGAEDESSDAEDDVEIADGQGSGSGIRQERSDVVPKMVGRKLSNLTFPMKKITSRLRRIDIPGENNGSTNAIHNSWAGTDSSPISTRRSADENSRRPPTSSGCASPVTIRSADENLLLPSTSPGNMFPVVMPSGNGQTPSPSVQFLLPRAAHRRTRSQPLAAYPPGDERKPSVMAVVKGYESVRTLIGKRELVGGLKSKAKGIDRVCLNTSFS